MPHRDTIAYGDRVELHGNAACFLNALLEEFAHLVEMAVPRDKALVAIANANKRLLDILALHAGSEEKTSVRCAGVAFFDLIGNHEYYLSFVLNHFSFLRAAMRRASAGSATSRAPQVAKAPYEPIFAEIHS